MGNLSRLAFKQEAPISPFVLRFSKGAQQSNLLRARTWSTPSGGSTEVTTNGLPTNFFNPGKPVIDASQAREPRLATV
jgi:hypothetical protein